MQANRVLEAHLRYLRHLTSAGGGTVYDHGGFIGFCNPHPIPLLVNIWVRTDPSASADLGLDMAEEFFSSQDRSAYEIVSLEGRDDDLGEAARERGLDVGEHPEPLQLLTHPIEVSVPRSQATEVRWAVSEADVRDVTQIAQAAHVVYGFPDDFFPTLFDSPATILAPDLGVVIVELEGKPVATAQIHLGRSTAYLGWVAVHPDAGRSGIGALATTSAVQRAFGEGAEEVALLASPMGAALYRRLGFEDVGGLRSIEVKEPAAI
jgi:ribosomal protein S18 acetylase RimI-like enzyme